MIPIQGVVYLNVERFSTEWKLVVVFGGFNDIVGMVQTRLAVNR